MFAWVVCDLQNVKWNPVDTGLAQSVKSGDVRTPEKSTILNNHSNPFKIQCVINLWSGRSQGTNWFRDCAQGTYKIEGAWV